MAKGKVLVIGSKATRIASSWPQGRGRGHVSHYPYSSAFNL